MPVASGVVAGGSLMGVALVFWINGGNILHKLFGGLLDLTFATRLATIHEANVKSKTPLAGC